MGVGGPNWRGTTLALINSQICSVALITLRPHTEDLSICDLHIFFVFDNINIGDNGYQWRMLGGDSRFSSAGESDSFSVLLQSFFLGISS